MKNIRIIAAAGLMALPLGAFAQKGVEDGSKFGHGQDSVVCINALVQYGDLVKAKNYKEAYEPWKIVFDQCPLAHGTTLYINGVNIAKNMMKLDAANKESYFDLLMNVYDQRAKYFGTNKNYPTSYLMGMKALDMITYKKDAAIDQALPLLEQAISGDVNTIQASFVQSYMSQTVNKFKAKAITADDVVNAYLRCSDLLAKMDVAADAKLAKATDKTRANAEKNKEAIGSTKENVELIFAQSGAADCEILSKIFQPMLADNNGNVDWLKKVNKLLSGSDCTESDLFYAISESLHKIEPQASSARGLAKMYLKQQDTDKAISYYEEAIKLETEDKLKSRYYFEMAMVQFATQKYAAAKASAQSSASLRDGWGQPYLLLAKIYATGANLCGEKDWEKRAGYWAAVDKAVKAKNVDSDESVQKEAAELIRQYSQRFPSKEDLFFENIKDGSAYHVGGFINENTSVRAKK